MTGSVVTGLEITRLGDVEAGVEITPALVEERLRAVLPAAEAEAAIAYFRTHERLYDIERLFIRGGSWP